MTLRLPDNSDNIFGVERRPHAIYIKRVVPIMNVAEAINLGVSLLLEASSWEPLLKQDLEGLQANSAITIRGDKENAIRRADRCDDKAQRDRKSRGDLNRR